MRHIRLGKELDDYMDKRSEPQKEPKSIRNLFRSEKMSSHKVKELECSEDGCVVVVNDEPNFFRVLHDKIMKFFKKKD